MNRHGKAEWVSAEHQCVAMHHGVFSSDQGRQVASVRACKRKD